MGLGATAVLFCMLLDPVFLQTLEQQGKHVNLFDPSLLVSFLCPVYLGTHPDAGVQLHFILVRTGQPTGTIQGHRMLNCFLARALKAPSYSRLTTGSPTIAANCGSLAPILGNRGMEGFTLAKTSKHPDLKR